MQPREGAGNRGQSVSQTTTGSMQPCEPDVGATGGRGRPEGAKIRTSRLDGPSCPLPKRLAIQRRLEEAKGRWGGKDPERRRMMRLANKMSEEGLEMLQDLIYGGVTLAFPSTTEREEAQSCRDRLAHIRDLAGHTSRSSMPAFRGLKLAADSAVEAHDLEAHFGVCNAFAEPAGHSVEFELHGNTVATIHQRPESAPQVNKETHQDAHQPLSSHFDDMMPQGPGV